MVLFRALTVALSGLILAGCAISPEQLTQPQLKDFARDKLHRVAHDQSPVTGPIDLYEAMARALKYNLDFKVELMEEALRTHELELARYDQLPQLVANAGYSNRNNQSGASSRSLLSGRESLEPSTSSERENLAADLQLSWDVLDFGLSYVRAKQTADKVLIALERRRKVANRVIEDVRTAYWRAVSSQRLIDQLSALETRVETAFGNSKNLQQRRNTSPLTALTYQRELMDIKRELQNLHRELVVAKFQLAALMNLPPDTDYELVIPARDFTKIGLLLKPHEMVEKALQNRPELREVAYRIRINSKEAEAALLSLLPNFKGFLGWNVDSNDFLYKQNWVSWGARASWNAMNLFSFTDKKDVIAAQDTLLDKRALALTMAIMTQAHVSRARYEHLRHEFTTTDRSQEIQKTIRDQVAAQFKAGTVSEQTLIREQMNALVAEFRRDVAFADLQNAFANIYSSIGLDPYAGTVTGRESVAELSSQLANLWRSRGDILRGPDPELTSPMALPQNSEAESLAYVDAEIGNQVETASLQVTTSTRSEPVELLAKPRRPAQAPPSTESAVARAPLQRIEAPEHKHTHSIEAPKRRHMQKSPSLLSRLASSGDSRHYRSDPDNTVILYRLEQARAAAATRAARTATKPRSFFPVHARSREENMRLASEYAARTQPLAVPRRAVRGPITSSDGVQSRADIASNAPESLLQLPSNDESSLRR